MEPRVDAATQLEPEAEKAVVTEENASDEQEQQEEAKRKKKREKIGFRDRKVSSNLMKENFHLVKYYVN